ncbi:MAG: ribokinase, partial [Friedmanniella sp.]|nr:ribokinase [Friedmanniella sp.]
MSGVAVVGSISVDLTAYGSPLPRPGETVIADSFSMVLGGKGANQALAAVRAGAPTYMVGAVGDDVFRELVLGTLTAEGVDTGAVQVVDGSTGVAHIRVDTTSGENNIAIIGNANFRLTPDVAAAELRRLADRVSVVLVQLEAPLETVVRIAEVCRELGLALVLDPAPARPLPDAVWGGVAVVTPNETEAQVLTGVSVLDRESAERAAGWFLTRGVDTVVITLAERGAVVVRSGSVVELPAHQVEAVDSTAAGDAFAG